VGDNPPYNNINTLLFSHDMGGKMKWVGVLTLVLFLVGCAPQEDIITIGAIVPLTGPGPVPFFGKSMRQGYDLGLEEINAEGGINGKQVKILYEDDQCDPRKTQTSFLKLMQIDQPDMMLGPFCGSPSVLAASLAEQHKQFVIGPGDNFGKLNDYYFSTRYPITKEGVLSAELAYEVGARKIGIIYYQNDWGETLRDVFTTRFEELGGEVVAAEGVLWDTVDKRTPLLKIINAEADGIYVLYFPGEIYKQMKELDIDMIKISSWEIEQDDTLEIGGAALNGVHYVFPGLAEQSKLQEEFARKYQEKYEEIPDAVARDSYDAFMITTAALRACDDFSSDCIRDYVKSIKDYEGVGGILTFNEELWAFDKPFSRKTVKDEQFVFVEGPKVVIS